MDKKVSSNRQKKEKIVAELADKFSKAKGVVFTNYQGLTHKQIEVFKKKLKAAEADLVISKNTLFKLALKKAQSSKLKAQNDEKGPELQNPTAALLLYSDPATALKELAKIIKELNLPSIKFGILENRMLSDKDVIKLSTLPSKEVLIMQLLGMMQTPVYGLHRALNWNIQKLVLTLNAIQKTKN